MSIAKRAIMVPIMTLAVCAIAMVGLGFAITTSVTSDNNPVEKLMVDLNDKKTAWDAKDNNPAATEPLDDPVNGLLKIGFSTDKSAATVDCVVTTTNDTTNKTTTCKATIAGKTIVTTVTETTGSEGTTYSANMKAGDTDATNITYEESSRTVTGKIGDATCTTIIGDNGTTATTTLDGAVVKTVSDGFTYAKIFGNMADVTMDVKVTGLSNDNKVTSITLSVYETTLAGDDAKKNFAGTNQDAIAVATFSSTDTNAVTFKVSSAENADDATFDCNKVYAIAITGLTIDSNPVTIEYSTGTGSNITGTWTGTTGTPSGSVSLGFTFTASA